MRQGDESRQKLPSDLTTVLQFTKRRSSPSPAMNATIYMLCISNKPIL
jgi:hypothetical protein